MPPKNTTSAGVYDPDIFKCEKSEATGWFVEKDGKKEWDKERVAEFWRAIRDTEMEHSYFVDFIFPEFEDYAPKQDTDGDWYIQYDYNFGKNAFSDMAVFLGISFTKPASFKNAVFLGKTDFSEIAFLDSVDFSKAQFFDGANFETATFSGKSWFLDTKFHDGAIFSNVQFKDDACFQRATFDNKTNPDFRLNTIFSKVSFKGEADFTNVNFLDSAYFYESNFLKGAIFYEISVAPEKTLDFSSFKIGNNDNFSLRKIQPQSGLQEDACQIIFRNNLPASISFRNVHLGRTSFKHTKIDTTQFFECKWPEIDGRKGIYDEIEIGKAAKSEEYEAVENAYCQLKHQFESVSQWQLAGDFHIGQMEMRRKRFAAEERERVTNLKKVDDCPEILLYWCQKKFGGYKKWFERFLLFAYKWISHYGERPGRAFWYILSLILIGACLLFPFSNQKYTAAERWGEAAIRSAKAVSFQQETNIITATKNPLAATKDSEIEQKSLIEDAILVTLRILSPLFLGLFLLAVRRKFKR